MDNSPFALWTFAAEEFADFVREYLPVVMMVQSQHYLSQVKTLRLLGAIDERLQRGSTDGRDPEARELMRLCEELSQHLFPVLAHIPEPRQFEYREILSLFMLVRVAS